MIKVAKINKEQFIKKLYELIINWDQENHWNNEIEKIKDNMKSPEDILSNYSDITCEINEYAGDIYFYNVLKIKKI
jgi:hypothetical protein